MHKFEELAPSEEEPQQLISEEPSMQYLAPMKEEVKVSYLPKLTQEIVQKKKKVIKKAASAMMDTMIAIYAWHGTIPSRYHPGREAYIQNVMGSYQ